MEGVLKVMIEAGWMLILRDYFILLNKMDYLHKLVFFGKLQEAYGATQTTVELSEFTEVS